MSQIIGGHTFVPLERNIDYTKLNAITSLATITSELISTQTLSTSAVTGDQFLVLKSGGTLARILYDDLATSLASSSSTVSAITSVRLRSFNAIGNPSFEVDQANVGNTLVNAANGARLADRWFWAKTGTGTVNTIQGMANVPLPGTNFLISRSYLRINVVTTEASLAAGDAFNIYQYLEGPQFRELINDTFSVSLLVRTTLSSLKFGWMIGDLATTKTLTKLCTITAPNTWQLIQLPNLPVFPAGNFSTAAGTVGQLMRITLAAGSSVITPANDTWQGVFAGAVGQDNFMANAGANFDIAFLQVEPGSQCTTLIDKPFTGANGNYDECLRYYQKSYDYAVAPGAVSTTGVKAFLTPSATTAAFGPLNFHKPLAKTPPTVTLYNHATGASGSVRDNAGSDHASAVASAPGMSGFYGISFTTATSAATAVYAHYTADTGW